MIKIKIKGNLRELKETSKEMKRNIDHFSDALRYVD